MAVKWQNNIGAPVVVVAIDLVTEAVIPRYAPYAHAAVAVLSYGIQFSNSRFGGVFLENMGIAALPVVARDIYDRARGIRSKPVSSRISSYPVPKTPSTFQGVRLV